jgi:hypothetical protein
LRILRNTDHHHRFRVEELIHFLCSSSKKRIYTGKKWFSIPNRATIFVEIKQNFSR